MRRLKRGIRFISCRINTPIVTRGTSDGGGFIHGLRGKLRAFQCRTPPSRGFSFVQCGRSFTGGCVPLLKVASRVGCGPALSSLIVKDSRIFGYVRGGSGMNCSARLFNGSGRTSEIVACTTSFKGAALRGLRGCRGTGRVKGLLGGFSTVSMESTGSKDVMRRLAKRRPMCGLSPILACSCVGYYGEVPRVGTARGCLVLCTCTKHVSGSRTS